MEKRIICRVCELIVGNLAGFVSAEVSSQEEMDMVMSSSQCLVALHRDFLMLSIEEKPLTDEIKRAIGSLIANQIDSIKSIKERLGAENIAVQAHFSDALKELEEMAIEFPHSSIILNEFDSGSKPHSGLII